jgi:hypothetical protein
VADTVIPGFGEAVIGHPEHQFDREVRVVGEFAMIVNGALGGLDAMLGRDAADPARLVTRRFGVPEGVDIEGLGLMDVAGPEQADVAVAEGRARGHSMVSSIVPSSSSG